MVVSQRLAPPSSRADHLREERLFMSEEARQKNINFADEHPPSRPGPKTAIAAAILFVGGLVIYYW
jgi:hypothetical protein